ncbi:hypothetical protein [Actinoplanes awajinensis]|uniref:hypothetical protein n=1 Tax=Actinoplanes awajinensis TaxID=135946 RepID=UPI0012F95616|nr:hypothetical protein [Actinoplanes awajinensis]
MKITKPALLMLVMAAGVPGGCAREAAVSSPPPGRAVGSVAPGCDPAQVGVVWSGITHETVLEHVSLFTTDAVGRGTEIVDAPVTAAVTGVAVPEGWVRLLATDLGAEIGGEVHTIRASRSYEMGLGSWGEVDPGISESIAYAGVRRVSAGFTVACAPAVSGTLTAWTETKAGGLMCGDVAPPDDPFTQAARQYCPRTPDVSPSAAPER